MELSSNRINIPGLGFSGSLENFLNFFDFYKDTRMFIKDCNSRYIYSNQTYAEMLGCTPAEVIGKSDTDFYEKNLAKLYLEEDKKTLAGESFINQRWMVPDEKGRITWCISHKYPLKDDEGNICGIFCTFRHLKMAGEEARSLFDLSGVVEYINNHFTKDIKLEDLAKILGLSISQLNRKFKSTLGETPIQYLLKVRINKASDRLVQSNDTVSEIAYDCGFNNRTYFNKQFKKYTGQTPSDYRKLHTKK